MISDQVPAWWIVVAVVFASGCDGGRTPVRNPDPEAASEAAEEAAAERQGDPAGGSEIRVVAMGDSLTEGLGVAPASAYPAQLEQLLRDRGHRVRVINAGVAGETSRGAAARVEWVLKLDPDIVILETGGNDGLRGIDPNLTASHLEQIVDRLRAREVKVLLAGMRIVQNMGSPYVEEFRAIYPQLASRLDVPLIPFFLEGVAARPEFNQADGIHPTAAGYTIVATTVATHLEPLLPPTSEGNANFNSKR